jgi:hypothetical protein
VTGGRRVVEVPAPAKRLSRWRRLAAEDREWLRMIGAMLAGGAIVLGSLYWSLQWSEPRVVPVPGPVVTVTATVTVTPSPTPAPTRR